MASQLKDQVGSEFIKALVVAIKRHQSSFSESRFHQLLDEGQFYQLELKARISALADAMGKTLEGSYKKQLEAIRNIAPEIKGLGAWVLPEFIDRHGHQEFDLSLEALRHVTEYFSSEFAIRSFIKTNPKKLIQIMSVWSRDPSHHVRRLSSEGLRPRLPWATRVPFLLENPQASLRILEKLKDDESLYVRKSVANHLNDISKDHPDLVIQVAKRWAETNSPGTKWIVRHGLRTLLKQGDQRALRLIGVTDGAPVKIKSWSIEPSKVKIGKTASLRLEIQNLAKERTRLRIEYAIHYVKKSGQRAKKVFQLRANDFAPGTHKLSKKHSFQQMTTRVHYPGLHKIDLIINGRVKKVLEFNLF